MYTFVCCNLDGDAYESSNLCRVPLSLSGSSSFCSTSPTVSSPVLSSVEIYGFRLRTNLVHPLCSPPLFRSHLTVHVQLDMLEGFVRKFREIYLHALFDDDVVIQRTCAAFSIESLEPLSISSREFLGAIDFSTRP